MDRKVPCFQKRLIPAKPLLCLKYPFWKIQIGSIPKHMTYHLFIQNFRVLRQTVWFQYLFEIWGNLAKFCWKIAFLRTFSSMNSYISVKVELNWTKFLYSDGILHWFWIAMDFSPFSEKKFAYINRFCDKNPVQPSKNQRKTRFFPKHQIDLLISFFQT